MLIIAVDLLNAFVVLYKKSVIIINECFLE